VRGEGRDRCDANQARRSGVVADHPAPSARDERLAGRPDPDADRAGSGDDSDCDPESCGRREQGGVVDDGGPVAEPRELVRELVAVRLGVAALGADADGIDRAFGR